MRLGWKAIENGFPENNSAHCENGRRVKLSLARFFMEIVSDFFTKTFAKPYGFCVSGLLCSEMANFLSRFLPETGVP